MCKYPECGWAIVCVWKRHLGMLEKFPEGRQQIGFMPYFSSDFILQVMRSLKDFQQENDKGNYFGPSVLAASGENLDQTSVDLTLAKHGQPYTTGAV